MTPHQADTQTGHHSAGPGGAPASTWLGVCAVAASGLFCWHPESFSCLILPRISFYLPCWPFFPVRPAKVVLLTKAVSPGLAELGLGHLHARGQQAH